MLSGEDLVQGAGGSVDPATAAVLQFASGAVGALSSPCMLDSKHRAGLEIVADGMVVGVGEDWLEVHEGTDINQGSTVNQGTLTARRSGHGVLGARRGRPCPVACRWVTRSMPPAHRRGRRSGPPPRCPGPGRTRDGGGDVHPRALQSLDECGPREHRTIGRGHHLHRVGTARLISCGDRPWSLIIAAGVDVVVDERLFALDPALEAPPLPI